MNSEWYNSEQESPNDGKKILKAPNISILPEVKILLVMTVNPGFAGQKLVPGAFDKIRRAREYLNKNSLDDIIIQVDGNCSFENVPKMYEAGADMFVVGTSSVFKKGLSVKEGTLKLLEALK